MKDNYFHELYDFGFELEFTQVNRDNGSFNREFHTLRDYQIVHDGSVETPILSLGNKLIDVEQTSDKDLSKLLDANIRMRGGGEIVSPILSDVIDWRRHVYKICTILRLYGEPETTSRDSFHVHINVGNSVSLVSLKNILRRFSNCEAILYRLGGMGRPNRGVDNDFIFQRPYVLYGPIAVEYKSYVVPSLNYDTLLKATTKQEFFDMLGSSTYHMRNGVKYITTRYMAVNLFCVLTYGTVEVRHANKTLDADYLIAWIDLCRELVKSCIEPYQEKDYIDNIQMYLAYNRAVDYDEFNEFLNCLKLSSNTIMTLHEIWNASPTPYFDNVPRFSHLQNPTTWAESNWVGSPYEVKVERARAIHYRDVDHAFNQRLARILKHNKAEVPNEIKFPEYRKFEFNIVNNNREEVDIFQDEVEIEEMEMDVFQELEGEYNRYNRTNLLTEDNFRRYYVIAAILGIEVNLEKLLITEDPVVLAINNKVGMSLHRSDMHLVKLRLTYGLNRMRKGYRLPDDKLFSHKDLINQIHKLPLTMYFNESDPANLKNFDRNLFREHATITLEDLENV